MLFLYYVSDHRDSLCSNNLTLHHDAEKHMSNKYDGALHALLMRFSIYFVPIALALVTLLSLFYCPTQYPQIDGTSIPFAVIEDDSASLSPQMAIKELRRQNAVTSHSTQLSEKPQWVLLPTQNINAANRRDTLIEFPSRHAVSLSCWNAESVELIGQSNRDLATGMIMPARTGFIINEAPRDAILCQALFTGPAQISVRLWSEARFKSAENAFHRDAGLLEGGLVVLSVFVFLTALINREVIYIIFAGWLIVNLRLAALSVGIDTLWFGRSIPAQWMSFYREFAISAYYLLTIALFQSLFREELKRIGFARLQRLMQWSCVPMLLLIAAPFRIYVPMMWVMTGFAGLSIVFLMGKILAVARTKTAIWFALAIAIAVFSGFSEVIAAAFGFKQMLGIINSVTAALASSLMAALSIAQQMRLERLARIEAEAELRKNYQEIPIGLFTLNMTGNILRGNPALHTMLRIPQEGSHFDSWARHFGLEQWNKMLQELQSQQTVDMEVLETLRNNGRWFLVQAKLVGNSIEGSLQDITARINATARLNYLANHDPLTGVINRRGIEDAIEIASVMVSQGEPVCIAYLDLDRFKLINDLYGHVTGDRVLQQVCARIKRIVPESNVLGRIGGDEFIVIMNQLNLIEGAKICQDIIDAIELEPFSVDQKAFRVGISIGLVEFGRLMTVDEAITAADRACSEAKTVNHVIVFDADAPDLHKRDNELNILKRFSENAPPEGLFLVMQPIMSLRDPYAALNFEVLLRMRRDDDSIESAWPIISAAENNGRIAIIDRWVLSNILEWIDENYDRLNKTTRFIDVNMSGGSLNDERFVADAFAMLKEHHRAAKKVCIEITESVAVGDIGNTTKFADQARDLGCRIALDDFGVGYTSFTYLSRLPVDVLKLDGSLITRALTHPTNLSIIEAIATLTRNLGMTSVAEWSDDLETIKAMVESGIDYIQGFIISEPQLPANILLANSAADFIKDHDVENYVRTILGAQLSIGQLDPDNGHTPSNFH